VFGYFILPHHVYTAEVHAFNQVVCDSASQLDVYRFVSDVQE